MVENLEKIDRLHNILKKMKRVLVAYSGGVDSTFLLKTSMDVLGKKNVLAVVASSETYPETEVVLAVKLAEELKAGLLLIKTDELSDPRFAKNPKERCFYCKLELFSKLKKIAKEKGLNYVVDGSNYDDRLDFRPGAAAGKNLGIRSPLKEAHISKEEIRKYSKQMKLSNWNKPSMACLASRIPYGAAIDKQILDQIGRAEAFLKKKYFKQVRVRHHGNIARIEISPADFKCLLNPKISKNITENLKKIGYTYITFDLEGFRSGSMNLVFKGKE